MTATEALKTIGDVTPSTRSIAARVITALEAATNHRVKVVWGYDADPGNTEHHSRRAVDFMCSKAAGKWITDYLWAHRAEFGLVHFIHDHHITSTVVEPGKRRKMDDRGNSTANHEDHVHMLLNGTARTIPPRPAVTRKPTAPTFPGRASSFYGPRSRGGNPGFSRYLAQWQAQMRRRGWTITADGLYGPQTEAVVRAFQDEKKLGTDGLIGPKTWAAAWTAPVTK